MSVYPHHFDRLSAAPSPLPSGEGVVENMRIMRHMRLIRRFGGRHLFCTRLRLAKQIWGRAFWQKCLILPHFAHEFALTPTISRGERGNSPQNMRIMRVDEGGLLSGFYLPCGKVDRAGGRKHEAVMRVAGALPHVFTVEIGG